MPGDEDKAGNAYGRFGAYLRSQRQLAQLTLRQLAELSSISNPYLSQIERGMHQPSVAVIRSIADALNLSADALLAQVAGLDQPESAAAPMTTELAIRADPLLTGAQKAALLSVYRSMVGHPEDVESGQDVEATAGSSAEPPPTGDADGTAPSDSPRPTAPRRGGPRRSRSAPPAPAEPATPTEPAPPAKRAAKSRRRTTGRRTSDPGPAGQPG